MLSFTNKLFFLRQVPLFYNMTFEQLQALIAHLDEHQYRRHEVIFYEGEIGQTLYILIRGRVRVVKDYGGPQERSLAVLRPRDFFGEMGIFEAVPHGATGVALEETHVFELHADHLKQLIARHPAMALEIARELSARIRHSTVFRPHEGGASPPSP